ncbi:MAG: flagellar L-ring protein precursor FlgH [Oceanicoccus sp.]|jgi:flagellar L-ring protein precursor FlgH
MTFNINRKAKLLTLVVPVLVALQGCTVGPKEMPNDPRFAPVIPASSEIPKANRGGIYQLGYSAALFEDRKANRVGDIITVVLNERTQSSKTADTEITKENEIAIDAGNVLGVVPSLGNYNMGTTISQARELTGEASSDQSNSLVGNIAVTIADILPNGLLVVRGEKWMTLNQGQEFIRVSGLIRPEDVQPDNTVLSTRLADARIAYSGTGDLADANTQGWASRFFNSEYWPF